MESLDYIGIRGVDQEQIEGIGPLFAQEGLLQAQKKSWDVFHRIKKELSLGMTEIEGRRLVFRIFDDLGVHRHWHPPHVRFGKGTVLTFDDPPQKDYRLKENDPVYLDLGPIWPDPDSKICYEGDVGDTFVFGENPEAEKCARTARKLFQAAREESRRSDLTGAEIYQFLREQAQIEGYLMPENVEGHRIGDFPHQKFTKSALGKMPFPPSSYLWVLEVQLNDPSGKFGAFFEDIF